MLLEARPRLGRVSNREHSQPASCVQLWKRMAPLDRKKYVVDVLEHVLAGVHATTGVATGTAHTEIARLGTRPWLGLGTRQLESAPMIGSPGGDAYDRRREHHRAKETERRSKRARRAPKGRLERQR